MKIKAELEKTKAERDGLQQKQDQPENEIDSLKTQLVKSEEEKVTHGNTVEILEGKF